MLWSFGLMVLVIDLVFRIQTAIDESRNVDNDIPRIINVNQTPIHLKLEKRISVHELEELANASGAKNVGPGSKQGSDEMLQKFIESILSLPQMSQIDKDEVSQWVNMFFPKPEEKVGGGGKQRGAGKKGKPGSGQKPLDPSLANIIERNILRFMESRKLGSGKASLKEKNDDNEDMSWLYFTLPPPKEEEEDDEEGEPEKFI